MVNYRPNTQGPDITITITGAKGSGKSCLMGDLVGMLELYGCEVRCFKRSRATNHEQPIQKPPEGHFNELRNVKIVEVV